MLRELIAFIMCLASITVALAGHFVFSESVPVIGATDLATSDRGLEQEMPKYAEERYAQAEIATRAAEAVARLPGNSKAKQHAYVETFLGVFNAGAAGTSVRRSQTRMMISRRGADHEESLHYARPDPTVTVGREEESVVDLLKDDPRFVVSTYALLQDRRRHRRSRVLWGSADEDYKDCVGIVIEFPTGDVDLCSGTLIAPKAVLAAAHCLDRDEHGNKPLRFTVVVHPQLLSANSNCKFRARAVRHPKYIEEDVSEGVSLVDSPVKHDIALFFLPRPVPASRARPRKMAPPYLLTLESRYRAAGYGLTERGLSGTRARVDLAVSSLGCDRPGDPTKFGCVSGSEIIAGAHSRHQPGEDTCEGDSGGPLYVQNKNEDPNNLSRWYLAGVTSRPIKCDTSTNCIACGLGGIYVRPDQYLGWIRQECRKRSIVLKR
jgi:hypothetical protein